jgi:drug/metabolite transporter (DMT)-like permease
MPSIPNHLVGIVLITASTLAWSVTGYFTRLIATDSVTLIAWRGMFGAICLVGVAILLRGRDWTKEFSLFGKAQLFYIAISTAGTVMLFTAFAYTSVGHLSVIFATLPFVAALFGWITIREVPSRSSLIASVAAVGGVAIMVALGSDGNLLGDFLALGMTITTTGIILLNRRYPTMPALGCSAASLALTSLLLWPFMPEGSLSQTQLQLLAIFAIVNSVAGVAFYALGSRRMPPVEVALISALDAPLAVLWVWIAFNEQPGWNTVVGGGVVICAVIFHIVASNRRGRRRV